MRPAARAAPAARSLLPRGAAVLFAVLCALGPARAPAHGDAAHKPRAAPEAPEQKPWGVAGSPRAATRSVRVAMGDDMRFRPDVIEVFQGETLRLRIHNAGRLKHEFVLGTRADLDAHAELMTRFPNMEHDEPYMAHVRPGGTGEIVWTFNRAGEFDFACLMPGHFQAGMRGRVVVKPDSRSRHGSGASPKP